MTDAIRSFVSSLGKANSVLVVVNENLSLPFALWTPAILRLLQSSGKNVTVLVSDEPSGWGKTIDTHYPTDMVLQLEALRQVIKIPFGGTNVGDVSYGVADGTLEIAINPDEKPLQLNQLKTETIGSIFDVVLLVGVTTKHEVINKLISAKSSLTKAAVFTMGSVAQKQTIQQILPFVQNITVLEGISYESLSAIAQALYPKNPSAEARELLTAFFYAMQKRFPGVMPSNAYDLMQLVTSATVNAEKLALMLSPDNTKTNALVTKYLNTASFDAAQHLAIFRMSQYEYGQLNATAQDALYATFFLPEYTGIETKIVLIELSARTYRIIVQGSSEQIKQIALKYGFVYSQEGTEGIITDIALEKLEADIVRVVGAELPTVPEVPMQQYGEQTTPEQTNEIPAPVQPQTQQIPVSPTLDEVLQNTVMQVEPPQSAQVSITTDVPAQQSPAVIPAQQTPVVSSSLPPVSKGLDFAAIAQKMRESIGK